MRFVWARARPDVGDDLRRGQRQQGAEAGGHDSAPPVARAPLAGGEEQDREQADEHVLRVHRDDPERVLDQAVVAGGEVVQRLEQREVDAGSVVARSAATCGPVTRSALEAHQRHPAGAGGASTTTVPAAMSWTPRRRSSNRIGTKPAKSGSAASTSAASLRT